jgi:hypothetical protein
MRIYIIPFTIKPDSYWIMDIGAKKVRRFIEWLWFRVEY